ncbi:nitrate/nitrite transporter [Streptomyces sp. NPDC056161]|uniref:MFS transporter n=1 Tax=Streptomyces sp. NPDC056161 TaxID=3345732 RepID=UPI0035DCD2EC
MTKIQRRISFLVLSMTGGIIFQVVYIRFLFLEPTYEALHLTAQQYGNIISIVGVVAMVMYFVGGWFADKFDPRKLIVIALAGTGLADLYLATVPGYRAILAVHIVMAVTGMGLYWSALVKSIGMLGDASEQGRLFGLNEAARGITSTVLGFVGTALVSAAAVASNGVLGLIRVYGVLALVFAVLVWFFVAQDKERLAQQGSSAMTLKQLTAAAKNKYTWLIGGTAMMMYCFYTTLGYFSPLLQNHYGVAAGTVAVVGVIRTYVFQFVGAPVGGFLADKVTRSSPKLLRYLFAAAALIVLAFLALPDSSSLAWLALLLMFVLTFMVFAARGVYWATIGEVETPENERGGVIGLASGVAYLPDAFLPALCAWWIGDPANRVPEQGGGYRAMFAFLAVMAVIGLVLATLTIRAWERELKVREPAADTVLEPVAS